MLTPILGFLNLNLQRVTLTIAQFCVPKGYPLTDQLKDVFLKSFEAGLHVRWNLEWKFLGTKVDYNKTTYVVSPMTLHDILVALYVLAFGLLSATIAFKAEIFVKKIWKN